MVATLGVLAIELLLLATAVAACRGKLAIDATLGATIGAAIDFDVIKGL